VKKPAPRSVAKKPAPPKPVAKPATKPAAKSSLAPTTPARPVRAAVQKVVAAMRAPAPGERAALAPMLARLDGRLEEIAQEFDRAKDGFGEASSARSASLTDRHQQRNLAEHATQMRLLTARRTELLWVRQMLLEREPAGD
jgi:hypothetical protein